MSEQNYRGIDWQSVYELQRWLGSGQLLKELHGLIGEYENTIANHCGRDPHILATLAALGSMWPQSDLVKPHLMLRNGYPVVKIVSQFSGEGDSLSDPLIGRLPSRHNQLPYCEGRHYPNDPITVGLECRLDPEDGMIRHIGVAAVNSHNDELIAMMAFQFTNAEDHNTAHNVQFPPDAKVVISRGFIPRASYILPNGSRGEIFKLNEEPFVLKGILRQQLSNVFFDRSFI